MSRVESPDVQLIELLRRADAPSDEDMQRVRTAVDLKLAVGIGASTAVLTAARSAWAVRLGALGSWTKGLALVTGIVGAGVGVTWYAKPEMLSVEPPSVSVKSEPVKSAATPNAPSTSAADDPIPAETTERAPTVDSLEPEVSPTEARATGPRASSPSKAAAARTLPSTLEAELVLLGRAQRALKSGQPGEALRALDEHAHRFPSGALALERSGVRTVALCQAGRLEEGRSAARNYLRLVPNSVLSKRIRVACQLPGE